MPKQYRILFLGQNLFGEAAWEKLLATVSDNLRVAAVCTNVSPDSVWWKSNNIYLNRGDIPLIDNSSRNSELILSAIREHGVNLILSVQHPWILTPGILAAAGYGALNFHNARLPEYKGYNAVNHALLNGDTEFVCTAHWIAPEVDAGEIALECRFGIAPRETALSLYAKCQQAGLALFGEVLRRLALGEPIPRRPITGEGRFYSRQSIEGLREITGSTVEETDRKSRAFFLPPFEPAYFIREGKKYYVLPEQAREVMQRQSTRPRDLLNEMIRRADGLEISIN
jgi:methionyl-tRNA formyltransferase